MSFKCRNPGCKDEFKTAKGQGVHEQQWCQYRIDSSRNIFAKRKAELEEATEAKRARFAVEQAARDRAGHVRILHCGIVTLSIDNMPTVLVLGPHPHTARPG